MAANLQAAAVNNANQLFLILQQFQLLRQSVNEFLTEYTNANGSANYGSVWANFPTCAQNADGSLGAADGTPNIAHPIDNRVIAGLNRAVSKTALANGGQTLIDFQSLLTNTQVAAANRGANIDALVS